MKKLNMFILLMSLALFIVTPAASAKNWSVPAHFPTIQAAIDDPAVREGDRILVGPGNFAVALITKRVEIKGIGGATIESGPAHPRGLIQGFRLMEKSSGATISHLIFKVDLAIMNGAAAHSVTVTHCTFLNPVQAVSNWRGSAWNITQNDIIDLRTSNGGGIGILIGDYTGGIVSDNVVEHNKISGILTSMPEEKGGYNGSGIVLYADFRGSLGAESIEKNRVVKNKVSLVSQAAARVDAVAFEMTDTRDNGSLIPVIVDNAVGFNDFRGTVLQIVLTPSNLDVSNVISRNLGENRGHGVHPAAFGPEN
ncbi:MAG: hypothetical protein M1418_08255 [Deltaproteobacteria bacterium]|nr:hypothetical protein [Deltaproteobacteria bacterium]